MTYEKPESPAVVLPDCELLRPAELAQAIVSAVFPISTNGFEGVECIVGKTKEVLPHIASWSREKVESLGIDVNEADRFRFLPPFKLTSADRASLKPILARIPELKHPVSEEAKERVRKLLSEYPRWKGWTLLYIDDKGIEDVSRTREEHYVQHMDALARAVKNGTILCCDAYHLPMSEMGIGALIPFDQAKKHLQSIGLSIRDTKSLPVTALNLLRQAQEIDWAHSSYVSEKLKALGVAADMWWQIPFDENLTKEDYRRFHEESVVPMLRRPAFAGRSELQRRAAEYIRPLYARRKGYDSDELQEVYSSPWSPELIALLLASRLWEGWSRKGNTPPPSKESVTAAIRQFLPLGFNATESFISDASKLLQPQDADTGRERQAKAKVKMARKLT